MVTFSVGLPWKRSIGTQNVRAVITRSTPSHLLDNLSDSLVSKKHSSPSTSILVHAKDTPQLCPVTSNCFHVVNKWWYSVPPAPSAAPTLYHQRRPLSALAVGLFTSLTPSHDPAQRGSVLLTTSGIISRSLLCRSRSSAQPKLPLSLSVHSLSLSESLSLPSGSFSQPGV